MPREEKDKEESGNRVTHSVLVSSDVIETGNIWEEQCEKNCGQLIPEIITVIYKGSAYVTVTAADTCTSVRIEATQR